MTNSNTPLQVMASQQRQRIPDQWLLVFADWSNDALLSMARDELVNLKVKAYAGWESDFRDAFGIDVPFPKLMLGDVDAWLKHGTSRGSRRGDRAQRVQDETEETMTTRINA